MLSSLRDFLLPNLCLIECWGFVLNIVEKEMANKWSWLIVTSMSYGSQVFITPPCLLLYRFKIPHKTSETINGTRDKY
jgi:hypothetical protein